MHARRDPRAVVLWPDALAVTEGVAGARTGRWTSVVLVLAVAWTVAVSGLANAAEVGGLIRAEQEWVAAGGRTIVVEPGAQGSDAYLDAAACARLAEVDGVVGSFAVRSTARAAQPRSAPGSRASVSLVSPGIFPFFGLETPVGAAVLATGATVDPLGLRDGDATILDVTAFDGTSATPSASTEVRVVESPVLSDEIAGTWLLPDLHEGHATSCYVAAEAARLDAVSAYVADVLTVRGTATAIVRPRLAESVHGLELAGRYADRPLGWSSVAGGGLLVALRAVTGWAGRGRSAVYATFGAHRRALLVVQVAEWTVLSSVGVAWGWSLAVTAGIALGSDPRPVLVQATAHSTVTWAVATLGVLVLGLLPTGTLLDTLKDRS